MPPIVNGESRVAIIAFAFLSFLPLSLAATNALYDANLGVVPNSPPGLFAKWIKGESNPVSSDVSTGVMGGSLPDKYFDLDSTVTNGISVAYVLNPFVTTVVNNTTNGIDLSFRLKVLDEKHSSTNRAGFSLIVIGSNTHEAIELAFWTNRVWTYNYNPIDDFTHGPEVAMDTTARHDYVLRLQNHAFILFVDNAAVLSGPLQDYTGSRPFPAPYDVANAIVFGDDTTEASSHIQLFFINHIAPVPPPPPTDLTIVRVANDIQLSFSTVTGALYDIQSRTNLVAGSWQPATNNIAGTGSIVNWTDPNAAAQSMQFYRVTPHL